MQEERRIRWTTIKVPKEVNDVLSQLSERFQKPKWKLILDSVLWFQEMYDTTSGMSKAPVLDKISWYISKLSMSVGAFKENPTDDNLEKLRKTIEQIEKRFSLDLSLLKKCAEVYKKSPTNGNRVELNMSLKSAVFDIVWTTIFEKKSPYFNKKKEVKEE